MQPLKPLDDPDWLRREYEERCRSLRAIAVELGCAASTVQAALERHDIAARAAGWRPPPRKAEKLGDRDWLRAQHALGRTQADIAEELGVATSSVGRALARTAGIQSARKWRGRVRTDPPRPGRLTGNYAEAASAWDAQHAAKRGAADRTCRL